MAAILRQWSTGDSHVVRLDSSGSQIDTGFLSEPTTAQLNARIAWFEQMLADERFAKEIEENMAEVLQ